MASDATIEAPEQERQAQLIEEFSEKFPELREAVEIFGVASTVYDGAGTLIEPTEVGSNTSLR